MRICIVCLKGIQTELEIGFPPFLKDENNLLLPVFHCSLSSLLLIVSAADQRDKDCYRALH